VTFGWQELGGFYRPVIRAVEFDLFTPPEQREELLRLLQGTPPRDGA